MAFPPISWSTFSFSVITPKKFCLTMRKPQICMKSNKSCFLQNSKPKHRKLVKSWQVHPSIYYLYHLSSAGGFPRQLWAGYTLDRVPKHCRAQAQILGNTNHYCVWNIEGGNPQSKEEHANWKRYSNLPWKCKVTVLMTKTFKSALLDIQYFRWLICPN